MIQSVGEAQKTTSAAAWLYLLTITPKNGEPLRIVNNLVPIVSRGERFEAFPFSIKLGDNNGESSPVVQLSIDNVSGELIKILRGINESPAIKIELITSLTPDILELSLDSLILRAISYDAYRITGTLEIVNTLGSGFPCDIYQPATFKGLFF